MPSFLKDLNLRRRSKASFNTANTQASDHNSSSSNDGNEDARQQQHTSNGNKSTSTLSSWFDKTSPPTTLASSGKSLSSSHLPSMGANGSKTPPMPSNRPGMPGANGSNSNRYSLVGSTSGESVPRAPQPATSALAPRVLSISDQSWVHQKVLLIYGQCADPAQPLDGTLTVYHHQDSFATQQWPVNDSHFKALVYLQPGPNRLQLTFTSPKLNSNSGPAHTSWISINYLPLNSAPPLQLCILVAKDSPETYDAVPERAQKEGNNLATAVRKFRMAAYLWQAFTAEQMNRNSFGRRCYRYEEEWQPGTLTWKDMETGQMRNEAKVHIIRMDKTVKEIQDLDIAQQNEKAKNKGRLFSLGMEEVKKYFQPKPGQTQYVSCMFLDSHWDKEAGTVRGHAALGGGDDNIKLAVFGSHALQSYPAHLEEVVPAFTDCTRTDTNHVANDCGESGSNWEAANIGIGAHLHETGHLLGCPHQESGVMLRDYTILNRTFTTREPYSTRTKQAGQRLCLPKDECAWHRLDALRFRYHYCFRLPTDSINQTLDPSIQAWTVDNGSVLVTAPTGVAWVEIRIDGDDICRNWVEFINADGSGPKQITLTEQGVRDRLPDDKKKAKKIGLKLFACSGKDHTIDDFAKLASKESRMKLPDGRPGFRSGKLGHSAMQGSQPQESIFAIAWKNKEQMLRIKVYHGSSLDGIEFCYEDGRTELFGKRGGKAGGSTFALDTRMGETILGFYLRAGAWIDGIQILTTSGRKSEIFGNATGGSGHTLIPPRGYSIAGIYGSCGPWIDGFGLIITR